ncbi:hypothetical protein RJ639_034141, partial [Escallonia herrerae]
MKAMNGRAAAAFLTVTSDLLPPRNSTRELNVQCLTKGNLSLQLNAWVAQEQTVEMRSCGLRDLPQRRLVFGGEEGGRAAVAGSRVYWTNSGGMTVVGLTTLAVHSRNTVRSSSCGNPVGGAGQAALCHFLVKALANQLEDQPEHSVFIVNGKLIFVEVAKTETPAEDAKTTKREFSLGKMKAPLPGHVH